MEISQDSDVTGKGSVLIIFLFALLSLADIVREFRSGESLEHLTYELTVSLIAFLWFFYLWYRWYDTQRTLRSTQHKIRTLNEENLHWRGENQRLISGLSHSIDEQMTKWKLTPAEKDVALLLLKGLSFKEIAELRGTSEKTTRQQSTTIYQKSSLPGRAELSAFFLEDLLGPQNLS
jgi:DNA-binding CsgD family transcriptional regulator